MFLMAMCEHINDMEHYYLERKAKPKTKHPQQRHNNNNVERGYIHFNYTWLV